MPFCPCLKRRHGLLAASIVLVLGILTLLCVNAFALTPEEQKEADKQARWKEAYPVIQDEDIQTHVDYLSSIDSRIAGYPGNHQAAEYVAKQFSTIGLDDVSQQMDPKSYGPKRPYMEEIKVAVPVVKKALKIGAPTGICP